MPLTPDPLFVGLTDQPMLPTRENFPVEEVQPGWFEVMGADIRQQNTVGSITGNEAGIIGNATNWTLQPYDPDFNLGEALKGTRYENEPGTFASARNREHFDAIMRDLDKDRERDDIIRRSSWPQYLTSMLVSQALDPVNWLSLGTVGALKIAGKGGLTLASRTAAIAGGVAVDTAIQEIVLQADQQDRTITESLANIGGSLFMGGLIGHVGSRLLLNREVTALSAMIEREMAAFERGELPPHMTRTVPAGDGTATSAGAMAARVPELADAPDLKFSFGVDYLSKWLGPQQRLSHSPIDATRRIAQELIETPYLYKGNDEGFVVAPRGSAMDMPGAVQTRIGSVWERDLHGILAGMRENWLAYRGAEHANFVQRGLMGAQDAMGRNNGLSEVEFRKAVTDAVFNGGAHEIPEVAKSASDMLALAARIEAANAKLIAEGKTPVFKEGQSAIPRHWLKDRITKERDRFLDIVLGHLHERRARFEGEWTKIQDELEQAASAREDLTAEQRSMREMDRLRDQALRDAEREQPTRYEGLPLRQDEIDTVAETWKYIQDVKARGRPETLTSYLIRTGGLIDKGGEVSHLTGGNKGRPGLLRKDDSVEGPTFGGMARDSIGSQNSLDGAALRAWEEGFFQGRGPGIGERPSIDEFLDLLREDLHNSNIVRDADQVHLDDIRIADEMAEELSNSYGIKHTQFRKESTLRVFFGERPRATGEAPGAGAGVPRTGAPEQKLTAEQERIRNRATQVDAELRTLADTIINRMLYAKEGRLAYDLHTKLDNEGFIRDDALLDSGDFDLPYAKARDFLERDMEMLSRMAHRSLIPDIEIASRFGSADMSQAVREIIEDATRRGYQTADPKERAKIMRQSQVDIQDVLDARDRLTGRYRIPDDPMASQVRVGRWLRDAAVVTKGGMFAFASIPETGRLIAARGFGAIFSDLIYPMMANWTKHIENGNDVRMFTHAMDHWTSSRAMALVDGAEDWSNVPKLDRFSRESTKVFMRLTGLPKLTDWQKSAGGILASKSILEAAEATKAGKATRKQTEMLSSLGISRENAELIADQFKAHGVRDDARVWSAQTDLWDEAARPAREAYEGAVRREVNRLITTPGLDTPNMSQGELGKIFFQFKSFAISSFERVLVSGLQHRDVPFFTSMIVMVGMAMATNEARKLMFESRDGKRKKSFAERWADPKERNQIWLDAVDKSGMLGWLTEPNNIADRVFGAGLSTAIGTGPQKQRRVADRGDQAQALAGPALGTAFDLTQFAAAVGHSTLGKKRWSETDTRQMERIMPFAGLHFFRFGLEQMGAEQAINRALNAKRSNTR